MSMIGLKISDQQLDEMILDIDEDGSGVKPAELCQTITVVSLSIRAVTFHIYATGRVGRR